MPPILPSWDYIHSVLLVYGSIHCSGIYLPTLASRVRQQGEHVAFLRGDTAFPGKGETLLIETTYTAHNGCAWYTCRHILIHFLPAHTSLRRTVRSQSCRVTVKTDSDGWIVKLRVTVETESEGTSLDSCQEWGEPLGGLFWCDCATVTVSMKHCAHLL